jgi:hypothetical protein
LKRLLVHEMDAPLPHLYAPPSRSAFLLCSRGTPVLRIAGGGKKR